MKTLRLCSSKCGPWAGRQHQKHMKMQILRPRLLNPKLWWGGGEGGQHLSLSPPGDSEDPENPVSRPQLCGQSPG